MVQVIIFTELLYWVGQKVSWIFFRERAIHKDVVGQSPRASVIFSGFTLGLALVLIII